MATVEVPITPSTNQTTSVTLPVNNGNLTLTFSFTYNAQASYWYMSITNSSGVLLLDGIPLVTGQYPAGNILKQYAYMNIGSAYIVPSSAAQTSDPSFDTLGTNFVLVWSDN